MPAPKRPMGGDRPGQLQHARSMRTHDVNCRAPGVTSDRQDRAGHLSAERACRHLIPNSSIKRTARARPSSGVVFPSPAAPGYAVHCITLCNCVSN